MCLFYNIKIIYIWMHFFFWGELSEILWVRANEQTLKIENIELDDVI